jgi:phosphatidate cytidylyltransferase
MQEALRNRLTYGSLLLAGLFACLWLDRQVEIWTEPHNGVGGLVINAEGHFGLAGVGILAMMIVILPIATFELVRLLSAERITPYKSIAIAGTTLLSLHSFLTQFGFFQPFATSTLAFIIVAVMIAAAVRQAFHGDAEQALAHMAGTVLSVLYLGGLCWFLMALRVKHSHDPARFQGSTAAMVMILLVVKSTDIGAYFGGRTFGRHKLIPWLSPGKTWEGLFFGLVTAALVSLACTRIWPKHLSTFHSIPKALFLGAVLGAVGQAGDLLESLIKRDAGVKDSGRLIPGFGGVLDLIDSPLLAAPFAYLLFSLL